MQRSASHRDGERDLHPLCARECCVLQTTASTVALERGDRVGAAEGVLVTLYRCNALLFLARVLQRYALQRERSPPAPPPGKRSFVLHIFKGTRHRGN